MSIKSWKNSAADASSGSSVFAPVAWTCAGGGFISPTGSLHWKVRFQKLSKPSLLLSSTNKFEVESVSFPSLSDEFKCSRTLEDSVLSLPLLLLFHWGSSTSSSLEEYNRFVDDPTSRACSISSSSDSRSEFSLMNGIRSEISTYLWGALLSLWFRVAIFKFWRYSSWKKIKKTAAFSLFQRASYQMKAFLAENSMRAFTLRGKRALSWKRARTGITSFAPIRSGPRRKRLNNGNLWRTPGFGTHLTRSE